MAFRPGQQEEGGREGDARVVSGSSREQQQGVTSGVERRVCSGG
jgi:hypothetical protein